MSDEQYAAMLAAQDGHCALCPSTPKSRRLHVDHDHETGAVRGLLCHRCNRNLPAWVTRGWLVRAADYIEPAFDWRYLPSGDAVAAERSEPLTCGECGECFRVDGSCACHRWPGES